MTMTMRMMRQLVANVEKKVEEVEVMMMMDGTVMMNIEDAQVCVEKAIGVMKEVEGVVGECKRLEVVMRRLEDAVIGLEGWKPLDWRFKTDFERWCWRRK